MNLIAIRTAVALSALGLVCGLGTSYALSHQAPTTKSTDQRIVEAANAFLATLDDAQRAKVLYAFSDNAQRARWSNFPTPVVPRGGINLRTMTDPQRTAAMKLLGAVLSPEGMMKVEEIREGDEVNKQFDKGPGGRGRPGGPPPGGPGGPGGQRGDFSPNNLFGRDLYYISFVGAPSTTNPWMLQFGGHHLALNITMRGSNGVLTPTLTGAQPSMYTENGKTVRPLGAESDKGLELVQSLSDAQRSHAVLSYRVADLVLGPGQDGRTIVPEGLKVSEMTSSQKELLVSLIKEWVGILNTPAATERMGEIESGLNDTYFAWSGSTEGQPGRNIASYYRIQGPRLVIEYAPQGMGGDASMHVHTMYRDPTDDYGRAFIGQ